MTAAIVGVYFGSVGCVWFEKDKEPSKPCRGSCGCAGQVKQQTPLEAMRESFALMCGVPGESSDPTSDSYIDAEDYDHADDDEGDDEQHGCGLLRLDDTAALSLKKNRGPLSDLRQQVDMFAEIDSEVWVGRAKGMVAVPKDNGVCGQSFQDVYQISVTSHDDRFHLRVSNLVIDPAFLGKLVPLTPYVGPGRSLLSLSEYRPDPEISCANPFYEIEVGEAFIRVLTLPSGDDSSFAAEFFVLSQQDDHAAAPKEYLHLRIDKDVPEHVGDGTGDGIVSWCSEDQSQLTCEELLADLGESIELETPTDAASNAEVDAFVRQQNAAAYHCSAD